MCVAEAAQVLGVADGMASVLVRGGRVQSVPLTVIESLGIVVTPGDFVLVHTGLAVAVLTAQEAAEQASFLSDGAAHDHS
jgi:hydrogenase assembly chaperone HypC/HupF